MLSFSFRGIYLALLIVAALFPFVFQSRFIYSKELALADFYRAHSYNESIGMQFGKYMENVLDLIDQNTQMEIAYFS